MLLNTPDLFTVPLLLQSFRGQFGSVNYGLIMAASAIATIPMLIAFVIGQRRIIEQHGGLGAGRPVTASDTARASPAGSLDLVSAPFTLPVVADPGVPRRGRRRRARAPRGVREAASTTACSCARCGCSTARGGACRSPTSIPTRVEFGGGATLTFEGPDALSLGGDGPRSGGVELALR